MLTTTIFKVPSESTEQDKAMQIDELKEDTMKTCVENEGEYDEGLEEGIDLNNFQGEDIVYDDCKVDKKKKKELIRWTYDVGIIVNIMEK